MNLNTEEATLGSEKSPHPASGESLPLSYYHHRKAWEFDVEVSGSEVHAVSRQPPSPVCLWQAKH